jgi:hypothetical protein
MVIVLSVAVKYGLTESPSTHFNVENEIVVLKVAF